MTLDTSHLQPLQLVSHCNGSLVGMQCVLRLFRLNRATVSQKALDTLVEFEIFRKF